MNLKAFRIPAYILVGIFSLGVLGYLLPEPPESAATATNETSVEVKEPEFKPVDRREPTVLETLPTPYVEVVATDIKRSWDNNRVNAEYNFDGVNVIVSGTVASIRNNVLEVTDNGGYSSLTCRYGKDQTRNVSWLNHRGPVTVRGELTVREVFGMSTIEISDCEVGPFS